jgi:hypothetical protein
VSYQALTIAALIPHFNNTQRGDTPTMWFAGAVSDLYVLRGLAAQSPGGDAKAPQPVWTPLEASGTPPTPRKGHAVAGSISCEAPARATQSQVRYPVLQGCGMQPQTRCATVVAVFLGCPIIW